MTAPNLDEKDKKDLDRFCKHYTQYMEMALKGRPGEVTTPDKVYTFLTEEARHEEVMPILVAFRKLKMRELALEEDRKDKMLSEDLYAKSEDGKRKVEELAEQFLELFDHASTIIIQIRRIPSPEARAKVARAVRMAHKNK